MLSVDEDALLCDFAETYRVFDIYQLPPVLAGTLAYGLRDDSRIKMKISGIKFRLETLILARIADGVSYILWQHSKDGHEGKNLPESLLKKLIGEEDIEYGFDTPEDFETARKALLVR